MDRSTVWLDVDSEKPLVVDLEIGQVAMSSRRCPGAETNEDGACFLQVNKQQLVLAVADGCGGMQGGAKAARSTLKTLHQHVQQWDGAPSNSLRSVILDGIEAANARILKMGIGAATTLAVVEVTDNSVRTYHVGDSQVFLVGGQGKVKIATTAHSPVGYAVEAGFLNPQEAILHDERHFVSNVVGREDCYIEVGMRQSMAVRDTLVMATDGVLDNLREPEVVGLARRGSLEQAANRLVDDVQQRIHSPAEDSPSKPDDATFILFRRNS